MVAGTPNAPPDGGWGWAVTAGAFIALFFTNGLPQSFGVFYVEFRNYFQADAKAVSLIGALMFSMVFFMSPISAGLANKKGCRPVAIVGGLLASISLMIASFATGLKFLYVFMGLLTGFGFSLGFVPCIGIVGQYFHKKHIMATATALSGVALGTVILPPLCNKLIEIYGWRSSLIILGAMCMNILVGSSLFRPLNPPGGGVPQIDDEASSVDSSSDSDSESDDSEEASSTDTDSCSMTSESTVDSSVVRRKRRKNRKKQQLQANENKKALDLSVFKSPRYLLICGICVLGGMSSVTSVIFLVPRAVSLGIPVGSAAYLMSVVGIVNFLGRLIQGMISNLGLLTPTKFLGIHTFVFGVVNMLFPLADTYSLCVLYAIMAGVGIAGISSLFPIVIRGIVGAEKFQSGVGLSQLFIGTGQFLGPIISGTLIDKTGGFKAVFVSSGVGLIICCFLLMLEPIFHRFEVAKFQRMEAQKSAADGGEAGAVEMTKTK